MILIRHFFVLPSRLEPKNESPCFAGAFVYIFSNAILCFFKLILPALKPYFSASRLYVRNEWSILHFADSSASAKVNVSLRAAIAPNNRQYFATKRRICSFHLFVRFAHGVCQLVGTGRILKSALHAF